MLMLLTFLVNIYNSVLNVIEHLVRKFVETITDYLPVKVIRYKGKPFLYRYHLFSLTNDGPGLCIHHFVESDPDRGYHDHPWDYGLSFILCGGYNERILNNDKITYETCVRNRWNFNFLRGHNVYHRVILNEKQDAWTLFFFTKRSKLWSMIDLKGEKKQMSTSIKDADGGWWNFVMKGLGVHNHLELHGKVIPTVDIIVKAKLQDVTKILLIKRGKNPCKGHWALPGGRIDPSDDDIVSAAKRELKEETHLDCVDLKYIKTIGNKTRDPRGFTLTNVFAVELNYLPDIDSVYAGDDAVDHVWANVDDLHKLDLAFDHMEILIGYLRE